MHRYANANVYGTGVATRAFASFSPAAVHAASMSKCWLGQMHLGIDAKTGPGTRRLGERSP